MIDSDFLCNCQVNAAGLRPVSRAALWLIENLRVATQFLHPDERKRRYGRTETEIPAVFIATGEGREILLSRQEIAGCDGLDSLKQRLQPRRKPNINLI